MATTMIRRQRTASPARWQAALGRALAEQVQVRQRAGSGAWIATRGTDATVTDEVSAHGYECRAGEFGDPVCKHRAAYWHALGVLDLDPEPEPPTSAADARVVTAEEFEATRRAKERIAAATTDPAAAACRLAANRVSRLSRMTAGREERMTDWPNRREWPPLSIDGRRSGHG